MSLSNREYLISDLVIDDEYGVIPPHATVVEVAHKMKELAVPDLVVVDEKTTKVLGVVGDFDIIQNVIAEGKDPDKTTAKDAMFVISPVSLHTPVTEAFARMQELNANVIPVVDNDKLVGVASIQDCWTYIPEENVDEIGMIPVQNPKNAEFWFASASALFAFLFAVILPLAGILGYFSANANDLNDLFGLATVDDFRSGNVEFYLFQIHSIGTGGFFATLFDLWDTGGAWWILTSLSSLLLLIFGLLGMFALIYTSYSDYQHIKTGNLVRVVFPVLFIVFIILEWVLYGIAFATQTPNIPVSIDVLSLILSILSIGALVAAINRDYLFVQRPEDTIVQEEK